MRGATLGITTIEQDPGAFETLDASAAATQADRAATISGTTLIKSAPDGERWPESSNRYVFTRTLGEGGMGEVLLCKDRRIGRHVAMKVVHSEHLASPDRRARFLREARIQGQLEHPAIVPVYDLELGADGHPFFTMKRVNGVTLEHIVERLRAGDSDTVREYTRHKLLSAFTRVCLAVDFAHSRGIVHRDLKPANTMLGRFGEVYVLDWGLAKGLEPEELPIGGAAQSRLTVDSGIETAVGVVVGTPAYMAPEQIEGRADRVGPRTDVYALGAILFELLTLETLHGSDSAAQMLARARAGIEARPSLRAPGRMVPPELEAICVRATARDEAARYASARELADAVEAHLSGDRDLELRRELAQRHLATAHELAARTMTEDAPTEDRTLALREAGRAIALAPDDDQALRVLVRLLTAPPKTPPPEVLEKVEQIRITALYNARAVAALFYLFAGLLVGGLALALRLSELRYVLVSTVAWLVASGVSFNRARYGRHEGDEFRLFTVVSAFAIAATSLVFGVLVIVPMMAAVNAMGQMITTKRGNRGFVVAMHALALVLPMFLVCAGLHPTHHLLAGTGTLAITDHHVASSLPLLLGGTSLGLAILLMCTKFTARCRDELAAAQTQNELQTWQLLRLVPEGATTTRR